MSTKSEVLKLLEENKGTYLSGEELAIKLNCSRTAVWKAMKTLREEEYEILAVNNRGYALSKENNVLSEEAIRLGLNKKAVKIEVKREIPSTNQYLKQKGIEEEYEEGSVVVAESQSAGKGRRGRHFYSPGKCGLYMSVLLKPKKTAQESLKITAAAAVAVCRAVEKVCKVSLGIKWVNDLYLGEKKVCGILTEAVSDFETGDIELVVVGIGINLKEPKDGFPKELGDIAGTVLKEGEHVDRNLLVAEIVNELLEESEKDGIPKEYIERNIVPGRKVWVAYGQQERSVFAKQILPDGRLLIENEQHEEEILPCGDVSLRIRRM